MRATSFSVCCALCREAFNSACAMSFTGRIFSSVVRGCVSWVPLVVKSRPPWLMIEFAARNRAACDRAETTRIDLDQLRVGQMYEVAFISDGGKIRAFRNFLGVLLLLDFVSGDADVVVLLQRQLNGLL